MIFGANKKRAVEQAGKELVKRGYDLGAFDAKREDVIAGIQTEIQEETARLKRAIHQSKRTES